MTSKELNQIQSMIQQAVKDTVNGKIDKIQKALDEHIEQHQEDRIAMEPIISNFNNWSGFTKIMFTIFFPILGVLGAFGGIGEFFNLFKK